LRDSVGCGKYFQAAGNIYILLLIPNASGCIINKVPLYDHDSGKPLVSAFPCLLFASRDGSHYTSGALLWKYLPIRLARNGVSAAFGFSVPEKGFFVMLSR